MVTLQDFTLAFSSLKTMSDIAKGMVSLHTMTEVQAKAIELNEKIIETQQQIFAAHSTQTTLVDRVRELEGQIVRMQDWDTQKQRYKLATPFPGCMIYAVQKSMSEGEPAHYLCAACFQKGQKSILQGMEGSQPKQNHGRAYSRYVCSSCTSEAITHYMNVAPPKFFEDMQTEG